MTTNRPLRVFLCHSSNDKPTVRELYKKLRAEPWIQPWLDEEELFPGMDWNLEIQKAIRETDAIVVCLSKGSITKEGYVQREIKTALDYADEKPDGTTYIIPIRLDECKPPERLARWQYADYFQDQHEWGFRRLLFSLKKRADSLGLKIKKTTSKKNRFEEKNFPIEKAKTAFSNTARLQEEKRVVDTSTPKQGEKPVYKEKPVIEASNSERIINREGEEYVQERAEDKKGQNASVILDTNPEKQNKLHFTSYSTNNLNNFILLSLSTPLSIISLVADLIAMGQISYNVIINQRIEGNLFFQIIAVVLIFLLGYGLYILGSRKFAHSKIEKINLNLNLFVWGYLILACLSYFGVVIALRQPYTFSFYVVCFLIVSLQLVAFAVLRSVSKVKPNVSHSIILMSISVLHALIFLYSFIFVNLPELNYLIGELVFWFAWTMCTVPMLQNAFNPERQKIKQFGISFRKKKPDIMRIGVLGPSGSGKTTYLTMLQYAEDFDWTIKPRGKETQDLYLVYGEKLRYEKKFPAPTIAGSLKYMTFDFEIKQEFLRVRRFKVVIPEVSGECFEHPNNYPDFLEEICRCQAIIWLIDPDKMDSSNLEARNYRRMIQEWIIRLYDLQSGGILKYRMAFCLSKMDLPKYSSFIDNPRSFCLGILGYDVEKILTDYCDLDNIEFFSTSSIGFASGTKNSNLDPDDSSKLLFSPEPINLFDPFEWIFSIY